tara:strand:+ start:197 stop:403 length:207 start_codon:yes stop_codon:yes gene_type:complete
MGDTEQIKAIQEIVANMSNEELGAILNEAIGGMVTDMDIKDQIDMDYIFQQIHESDAGYQYWIDSNRA